MVATIDGATALTREEKSTLQLLRRLTAHGFGSLTVTVRDGRAVGWSYQETHTGNGTSAPA